MIEDAWNVTSGIPGSGGNRGWSRSDAADTANWATRRERVDDKKEYSLVDVVLPGWQVYLSLGAKGSRPSVAGLGRIQTHLRGRE